MIVSNTKRQLQLCPGEEMLLRSIQSRWRHSHLRRVGLIPLGQASLALSADEQQKVDLRYLRQSYADGGPGGDSESRESARLLLCDLLLIVHIIRTYYSYHTVCWIIPGNLLYGRTCATECICSIGSSISNWLVLLLLWVAGQHTRVEFAG